MTAIEQSPSLDPERKWKRIIICDGGGPGPGSSDNLTLDLVSAAAANAPSLIKKIDGGRYSPTFVC